MKTILLFLAAATALFATESPTSKIDGLTDEMPNIRSARAGESLTIKGEEKIAAAGLCITEVPAVAKVFEVSGIPQVQFVFGVGASFLQNPSYKRPEKPGEVKANLWTADGKKWAARWEEVKP